MCGLADWPEQYRACQPPISTACCGQQYLTLRHQPMLGGSAGDYATERDGGGIRRDGRAEFADRKAERGQRRPLNFLRSIVTFSRGGALNPP